MSDSKFKLSKKQEFICGSFAGLCSDLVAHPLDTIRARTIMKSKVGHSNFHYKGVFDAISAIGKTEGLRGYYKGFMPVFFGTIPAHGLYFFGYEESKRRIKKIFNVKNDQAFLVSIASGLIADLMGSLIWVPMDVIKQQVMVYPEKTVSGVISNVLKSKGPLGFYRGYVASMISFAPYVMFNFSFYEKIKLMESKILKKPIDQLPKSCYFFGAVTSSYLSSLVTTPFCVGRTRIQVQMDSKNSNIFKEMYHIVKYEGVKSIIDVWKARSLWFAVGAGVSFLMYEIAKNHIKTKNEEKWMNETSSETI